MGSERRLIDANELLDFVKRLKFEGGTKTRSQAGQEVLDIHIPQIVAKIETIDAVEVVRCVECAVPHNRFTGCPKLNGLVTTPDFYCPYGERRTDG